VSDFGKEQGNLCRCGCGRQLPPRTPGAGRPVVNATKSCGRIYRLAIALGWLPGDERTPRQYLKVKRKEAREHEAGAPSVAALLDQAMPIALINPRACACGCGRAARFYDRRCAGIVAERERQGKTAKPEKPKKPTRGMAPPWQKKG